jgi:hypothetical protein
MPGSFAGDFHLQVRHPGRPADVFHAAFVGEVPEGFTGVGVPGRVKDPLLPVAYGQQGPVGLGVGGVAGDEALIADHVREPLGPEGDAHVVEQVARAGMADVQPLSDRAPGPVCGDEVVRAHAAGLAGHPVAHDRRHPFAVLLERDQSGAEAQAAAEFAGAAQQHGLQVALAAQTPPGGAEAGEHAARFDLPEQPLLPCRR